ncbi:MAG: LPS export ABC transporter periplasmic protein LptC [Planctomycetes bacterium]|nr:LPS export ABC transporter periplasmic protein LptC [Planctomycetota bacterium]
MMLIGVLLAALLSAPQEAGQQPTASDKPVLEARLYDDDGYVTVSIRAESTSGIKRVGQNVAGEFKRVDMTWHTQPNDRTQPSRKVGLRADRATVDFIEKKTIELHDSVVVVMEGGPNGIGWTIEAPDLFLDCETQILRTQSDVVVRRPDAFLRGSGLEADNALRRLTILRNGTLQITGALSDLAPPTARPSEHSNGGKRPKFVHRLRSTGPLSIRDMSEENPGPWGFVMISARDGVRLEREDEEHNLCALADSAVIHVAARRENGGRSSGLSPCSVTLRKAIQLQDSAGLQALAETLDWNAGDDLLRLTGAPCVETRQGEQLIRARTAVIDRWIGRVVFNDDLTATLTPENGQKLHIQADQLEILTEKLAGKVQPSQVRASGNVHLQGDVDPSRGRIAAAGSTFVWNASEGRGRLEGAPFAQIDNGGSHIRAPEIVFEGRSMLVVKGPKVLRFVRVKPPGGLEKAWAFAGDRPADGRTEEVLVRCEGDLSYDGTSGRIALAGRCRVTTQDVQVAADRLFLRLTEKGDDVSEMRGFGAVRLQQKGVRATGDMLAYDRQNGELEIHGEPWVTAWFAGLETRNAVVRLDLATKSLELVAGRHRGRIQIPK